MHEVRHRAATSVPAGCQNTACSEYGLLDSNHNGKALADLPCDRSDGSGPKLRPRRGIIGPSPDGQQRLGHVAATARMDSVDGDGAAAPGSAYRPWLVRGRHGLGTMYMLVVGSSSGASYDRH